MQVMQQNALVISLIIFDVINFDRITYIFIDFSDMQNSLRTFKINRITLSPQMFALQDNNDQILDPKVITPYLKRFNLNNKKYIKLATFNNTKYKRYSIQTQPNNNNLNATKNYHQYHIRQIIQRSKLTAPTQYQEPQLSKSQPSHTQTNKTYTRPKPYEIMYRQKTEGDQLVSNLIWNKFHEEKPASTLNDQSGKIRWKTNKNLVPPNMVRQKYFQARNFMNKSIRERNPHNKCKNSILKTYKIKTIQLMSPQENTNKTVSKFKNTLPYFIDLANDDNLRQIHLQDLQKIQTQKYKIKHRKILSNQLNFTMYKRRPSTQNISQRHDDFQPCPWQYQSRHQIFTKQDNQF